MESLVQMHKLGLKYYFHLTFLMIHTYNNNVTHGTDENNLSLSNGTDNTTNLADTDEHQGRIYILKTIIIRNE